MRSLAILGSTGSVGESTLRVLPELAGTHRVTALVAHRNVERLVEQALALRPECVGLSDPDAAGRAADLLSGTRIRVLGGADVAERVVAELRPDIVLAAITGAAGLPSSLRAVEQGSVLALANKEALVMAGHLMVRAAAASGAAIVPVDSEHSAIFQCLHGEPARRVRRLFLTASGGPFHGLPAADFARVTPAEALRHPTWTMGRKITIDSATLMNKALEIVEARWLFDVPAEAIQVVVHRQSIVHSMVEFVDGSILAQLGLPSMTVPVRVALAWPERAATAENYYDVARFASLTFEEPDLQRFPALRLGFRVARELGLAGTALNAANEVAVERFLIGRAPFPHIAAAVEHVLDRLQNRADPSLDEILAADRWARLEAERWLETA